MLWNVIDATGRKQHGLITHAQLRDLGLSEASIWRAVRSGRLVRVRTGVYRLAGTPLSQEQAWLAAVLSARGDAVLSHRSAAAAWRLRHFDAPDRIDLLIEGEGRTRMIGIRPHRTLALPTPHRTRLHRIPITTAERTLIDVCGVYPTRQTGRILDDALRRKTISLPRLVRTFETVPVSGRRKSGPMTRLLRERLPGFNPGGSAAELDVMAILRRAGIRPLPEQQFRIRIEGRTYKVDYCWPDTRHVIEFDGAGGHDTVSARHDDRDRWRRLQRAGYTVWPVTEETSEGEIIAIGVLATSNSP
ncbi:MAG: type IV toxin-antitoxin system AbiEi family antitoxin domain-containing protein [Actinobacteria bacterium]|nr:type IV toxin-antitoxin system AbiEi family antitoxin domain-containing protein [Actinomycetota bacterium]